MGLSSRTSHLFKLFSQFPSSSLNNLVCGSGSRCVGLTSFIGNGRQPLINLVSHRFKSTIGPEDPTRLRKRSTMYYLAALGVIVTGASYAAVPLYRIFCQSYSYGGTTGNHGGDLDLSQMKKKDKKLVIKFNADRSSSLQWNFRPEQAEIIVSPGETALAFYRAENRTSHAVDGISTYNVIPFEAGQYFNKIQCFCFEEQRLNPGETVELPVFFYIDPEFTDDPKMENVDTITLSYTFFESKEMPNLNIGNWSPHKSPPSSNPTTSNNKNSPNNVLVQQIA